MRSAAAYSDGISPIAWSANVAWSAMAGPYRRCRGRPTARLLGTSAHGVEGGARVADARAPEHVAVDAEAADGVDLGPDLGLAVRHAVDREVLQPRHQRSARAGRDLLVAGQHAPHQVTGLAGGVGHPEAPGLPVARVDLGRHVVGVARHPGDVLAVAFAQRRRLPVDDHSLVGAAAPQLL